MAKLFEIKPPEGMSSVKLDSQGRATVQFTVTNVSAREIDGRAVLISLPQTKPPSGPVEKGWVTVDGNKDRHFGVTKDVTTTFAVKISVPPNSPAGTYAFRLDTVSVDVPDDGDSSVALAFTVAATAPRKGVPSWLIAVIVLVLIAVGVGAWLALRGGGPKVPDLSHKTIDQASSELTAAGLTLDPKVPTLESKPEDSGLVISTVPPAGQKVAKGQTVQVTLGAEMVTVPQLVGHTYKEVLVILTDSHLTQGQTKTAQNPNFALGVVIDQSPAQQQVVKSGTAVDMSVTPQAVLVPNFVGMTFDQASAALNGLALTSFSGDRSKTVVSQNPAAGTSVPVGSPVTLVSPPPDGGCVFARTCILQGDVLHRMVFDTAMRVRDIQKRNVAPQ